MSNLAMMMGLGSAAGGTPWLTDLSVASYDSVSIYVNAQDSVPNGITFGYDGLRMYMTGDGSKYVNQYDLTTEWDLSTASYASKRFYIGSQVNDAGGVQFKPDGTKMYVYGKGNSPNSIHQYSLSTAWDVSTASYDSVSFNASTQISGEDLFFSADGDFVYVTGLGPYELHQFTVSTPWDISTATTSGYKSLTIPNAPFGIFFNSKGDKLYMAATNILEYELTTPYDISTASAGATYNAGGDVGTTSPASLYFKPDGSKMYVSFPSTDYVYQFTTA